MEVFIDGMSLNAILSFHSHPCVDHSVSLPALVCVPSCLTWLFSVGQGAVVMDVFVPQVLSGTSPTSLDEWKLNTEVLSAWESNIVQQLNDQ